MQVTSGGDSSSIRDRDRRQDVSSREDSSTSISSKRPARGEDEENDDDREEEGDEEDGRQLEPGVKLRMQSVGPPQQPLYSARAMMPPTDDDPEEGDEESGRQLEPGVDFKPMTKYYLIEAEEPTTSTDKAFRHAAILALLAFASIWGTLTREGLIALNTYSGMSIAPTIWAQSFGCLVIGWAVANRQALENWYAPMYIAIGTGYCGSVTTFSTWILEVFEAFGNKSHYNRHGLHNVMDALTQTGATLGMSIISVSAGMSLAHILPVRPLLHKLERMASFKRWENLMNKEASNEKNTIAYSKHSDVISIIIGVLFWAASAIFCGTYPPFRAVTFAIVLSPPGAILRWYLSRLNSIAQSKRAPYWPLGTLAANLLATLVIAAVYVGQNVGRVSGRGGGGAYTINGCHALYGVQQGFCGCLSTISTFVTELRAMKPRRRAFGYVAGSWLIGIIICVLIIGSPWWSIGMDGSCKGITL